MNKNRKLLIIIIYILIIISLITAITYLLICYHNLSITLKQSNLLNEISIDKNIIAQNEVSPDNDTNIVQKSERIIQVEELQKINPDIIGWIEIENTNINYPVLQGTDNSFYLNHDYQKEKNKNGAIFLDANYIWNPPSSNLLIYGHNNQNGTMFEDLLKYKNEKFYQEHPLIRFTTNTEDSYYEIISVFNSKVYYKSQNDVFKYYYFINANDENEFNEYIKNVKQASLYDTGKTAQYGEQLMTLSTCSYHTKDGRFVVVAKKQSLSN